MPIYEYRCDDCAEVTSARRSVAELSDPLACEHCGGSTHRIVSKMSVHLSKGSKVRRMDPKYDAMVDQAMRNTPLAEPDRLINRRGDISKGLPDRD